ncbi:sulfotransferase [Celeribacter baekdonensis]|uniref:Sulfotransferase family protein n=1 Tax=Celeribacter baekdonensis TaxID=875171 RepID=A0A2R4M320_9RHOB|nr:sulfotransferase [Celeribacter baekdonensis]AVW91620.1 sulfotransferase family protein [Celeribacter baekdonensis]
MSDDPAILICVGATKAGTSSLYRYLHDHPDCHMRSIKEIHYFDTVDFEDYEHQFDVLARLRSSILERQEVAQANGNAWKVGNLQRQLDDVAEMVRVLKRGQDGVSDYLFYLLDGADGKKLVGDITPGYCLLSEDRLRQMAHMTPDVRFLFLMRDPVDRLWSHVRMQAARQRRQGEEVAVKAKRIMNRVVNRDLEKHIAPRGDYVGIVERLKRAVPEDKLLIGFTEDVMTGQGLTDLCRFLGISAAPIEQEPHAHEGVKLKLSDKQRREAAEFLAPQYAYVEKTFGPLPSRWQANMARI